MYQLRTVFLLLIFSKLQAINAIKLEFDAIKCYKIDQIKYTREEMEYLWSRSSGSSKLGTFESPNYPFKYNKYIDCVFLIHAPQGHVIEIKSFERFDIEPSVDCEHDYLEFRDGLFGYSPFIGRFCNAHPLMLPIESRNTDMWVRFKTDESIEQMGFRIIFEYKKVPLYYKPTNSNSKSNYEILNCEMYHKYTTQDRLSSQTITNVELEAYYYDKINELIRNKNMSSKFDINFLKENLDCTIHIEVHVHEKISILFEKVNVTLHKNLTSTKENQLSIPDENCVSNFLQVYDGSTSEFNKRINYCTSKFNQFFKSKTNRIFIRYSMKRNDLHSISYFKLTYNPFAQADRCAEEQFRCSDGSCIDNKLICDGKRNCNTSDDEESCERFLITRLNSQLQQPIWTDNVNLDYIHKISIISIGTFLLIIIIISLYISFRRSVKLYARNVKEFEKIYRHSQTNMENTSNGLKEETRGITGGLTYEKQDLPKWVI